MVRNQFDVALLETIGRLDAISQHCNSDGTLDLEDRVLLKDSVLWCYELLMMLVIELHRQDGLTDELNAEFLKLARRGALHFICAEDEKNGLC